MMSKSPQKLGDLYPAFKRVEELTKGSHCSVAHLVNCMTEEEVEAAQAQIDAARAQNPDKFREAMKKRTLKMFGKERIT